VVDLALSDAADAENPDRGDVLLRGGDVVLISDRAPAGRAALVRQRLELALSILLGTWRLDLTVGLDYRALAFERGADPSRLRAALEAEALRDPDVAKARATVTGPTAERALRARVDAVLSDGAALAVEVPA
jgi:hypothetical protein